MKTKQEFFQEVIQKYLDRQNEYDPKHTLKYIEAIVDPELLAKMMVDAEEEYLILRQEADRETHVNESY